MMFSPQLSSALVLIHFSPIISPTCLFQRFSGLHRGQRKKGSRLQWLSPSQRSKKYLGSGEHCSVCFSLVRCAVEVRQSGGWCLGDNYKLKLNMKERNHQVGGFLLINDGTQDLVSSWDNTNMFQLCFELVWEVFSIIFHIFFFKQNPYHWVSATLCDLYNYFGTCHFLQTGLYVGDWNRKFFILSLKSYLQLCGEKHITPSILHHVLKWEWQISILFTDCYANDKNLFYWIKWGMEK